MPNKGKRHAKVDNDAIWIWSSVNLRAFLLFSCLTELKIDQFAFHLGHGLCIRLPKKRQFLDELTFSVFFYPDLLASGENLHYCVSCKKSFWSADSVSKYCFINFQCRISLIKSGAFLSASNKTRKYVSSIGCAVVFLKDSSFKFSDCRNPFRWRSKDGIIHLKGFSLSYWKWKLQLWGIG